MISDFVELVEQKPHFFIDLPYARDDNFMGEELYEVALCFVHKNAKAALDKVVEELAPLGLGLLIWDCYRPRRVQQLMWDRIQDERFVSDPSVTGGRHMRGTAVDLTLVDSEGNQLLMPTGFDDFTEAAHQDYMDLPEEAIKNRKILRDAMEKHGFTNLASEWWHFDLNGWERYPSYDVLLSYLVGSTNAV